MDNQGLWELIEAARGQVRDPADAEAVAARAATLLSARPPGEIVAADEVLWGLMADSYRNPLWAAAYLVNGGCSDDGFEYFRGWLIMQGREVYERVVADPDALAGLCRHWGQGAQRPAGGVRGHAVYRLTRVPGLDRRGTPRRAFRSELPGAGPRMGLRLR